MPLTITAARAEIKMLGLMIAASRAFIIKHLFRPDGERDPINEEGGEQAAVQRQIEAVLDMENRMIALRRAVVLAGNKAELEIGGRTMSIGDWEFWRREIAPKSLSHGHDMANAFNTASGVNRRGVELIRNVAEEYAADLINELEQMLCLLNGQLAVANAITMIEVAEDPVETDGATGAVDPA